MASPERSPVLKAVFKDEKGNEGSVVTRNTFLGLRAIAGFERHIIFIGGANILCKATAIPLNMRTFGFLAFSGFAIGTAFTTDVIMKNALERRVVEVKKASNEQQPVLEGGFKDNQGNQSNFSIRSELLGLRAISGIERSSIFIVGTYMFGTPTAIPLKVRIIGLLGTGLVIGTAYASDVMLKNTLERQGVRLRDEEELTQA